MLEKAKLNPMKCNGKAYGCFEPTFDSSVIRISLQSGWVHFIDVEGEEFGRRLTYLLDKVCNSKKDKRFFLISPFFMWDDYRVEKPSVLLRREFTRVLSDLKLQNAVYIDGLTLFGNPRHLNTDAVHPDPRGHEIIAERLVKIIKDYI